VPKTILIAPDSFKGSLSAHEVAIAIEQGVIGVFPDARILRHPISDGGEGLVKIVTPQLGGKLLTTNVSGPLPGQRVDAMWGFAADRSTAIIEMAEAAGLPLVPVDQRDPKVTTTFGVGELIKAGLDAGAKSIIVGIGGSATNDGGAGMAEALGVRFLDATGKQIARGGAALEKLARIDLTGKDPRLGAVEVLVACDVQNALCGPEGASAVYGPQKGASLTDVELLDRALERYGTIIRSTIGIDVLSIPGGGAAGGLGAGLVAFCGATLKRGIDLFFELTGFEDRLKEVDLVITGEGRIDPQVKFGKALAGVIDVARRHGVPTIAVVGAVDGPRESFVNREFLAELEPLANGETSVSEAMKNASVLLSAKTKLLLQRYFSRT
jgi:glycerate kinase